MKQEAELNKFSSEELLLLENRLAKRLFFAGLVPVIATVVLGVYAWRLSAQIDDIDRVTRIQSIETYFHTSRNYPWAIGEYVKLSNDHPTPEIYARLAGLSASFGKQDEALEYLALSENSLWNMPSGRESDSASWAYYRTATSILAAMEGRERHALEAGKKALELNAFDGETYNNLAWIYHLLNDPDADDFKLAQEYSNRAVDYTRREDAYFLSTLSRINFKQGQVDEGRKLLDEAIKAADANFKERLIVERERLNLTSN